MPSIPNFWEGGPHDPIDVEASWREFVRSINAQVVEDLLPEPRIFENADFLFQEISAVAELKEIQTEFSNSTAFNDGFVSLIKRLTNEAPNWKPALFGGSGDYPAWFSSEFIRLFRPPISRILKKANRQIKDTKRHFKIDAQTGVLILVNDGFTSLEPHFVRQLACHLLQNSYSSIDCFLYLTVNRYVEIEGSDVPRLLWMPTYSDRAPDYLATFIDELGRKWFDFLEAKTGSFTIAREEIPQGNGVTPPLISRAIVLPSEKR